MTMGCSSRPSKRMRTRDINVLYWFYFNFWLILVYRGLSIERVITSFLKIHCVTSDPSSISLVLVINTTDQEEVGVIFFSYAMH